MGKKQSIKPWWLFNLDSPDEKALLKALNGAYDTLVDDSDEFKQECLQHLALYQGMAIEQEINKKGRIFRDTEGAVSNTKFKPLIINHLRDITDSAVSRLATFKPAATVLPNHGVDNKDKAKAKVVQSWLQSFSYSNNIDDVRRKVQRNAFIFGEAYLLVEWDEKKGDIHPAAKKLKKDVEIETDEGKVKVSKLKRVGDVGLKHILPFKVFPEPHPSADFERCNWVMTTETEYLEQLQIDYPEHKKALSNSKIDVDNDDDYMKYMPEQQTVEVEVKTLYIKASPEVPEGRLIKFTDKVILENKELPYSHGMIPLKRMSCLDIPGQMRGSSPFKDLKALQSSINKLYSIMIRDRSLASPKLFVPAGSIDPNQSKTNTPSVVQYKGGVPPTWSVPNMISQDIMAMIEKLENTFEKLSNSLGTRRGEGIPNVEAFKAFGFFEEQASKRDSTYIAKHKDFLQELFLMITLVAGDYYTQSDERMIKMLGRHNQYVLKSFNVEDLKHSYDIRIQNTTALPESKSARIQTILQLNQALPNQFTEEKIADLLDLSTPDAFFDLTTAAINAAESENDEMLSGKDVAEPQPFEDLITHWETHYKQFNSPTVKDTLPKEPGLANALIQETLSGETEVVTDSPALLMAKHLNTTEGLMFQKALINPKFANRLADFEHFPVFFQMPMSISEIIQSHAAPMQPVPPDMGLDQEVVLPETQQPNPNNLGNA